METKHLLFLVIFLTFSSAYSHCAQSSNRTTSPTDTTNRWAIDMTPVKIGRNYYAVWSGWDNYFKEGEADCQNLYIAKMTFHNHLPYVRLGKRHILSEPELIWELKESEHISLLEGPAALSHDNDVFIFYSTRGSWTKDYKIGQLRLKPGHNPLDKSSWIKSPIPVFQGITASDSLGYEFYGTGHACFVLSPDEQEYWINFHSKTSADEGWTDRKVFFARFQFDEQGNPDFGVPSDPNIPVRRPSGEYERLAANASENISEYFSNPVREGADPWITRHRDKYYTCSCDGKSIYISESDFMTCFENNEPFYKARQKVWTLPEENSGKWNIRQLWAPELHFIKNKWYIFYTAGIQIHGPFPSQRSGVLVSESGPFGPYYEHGPEPLFTGEE